MNRVIDQDGMIGLAGGADFVSWSRFEVGERMEVDGRDSALPTDLRVPFGRGLSGFLTENLVIESGD